MESFPQGPQVKDGSEPDFTVLKSGPDAALAADAQRRADHYLLLSDAGRELMALRTVPEVCDALYAQTKRLVDCSVFYIGLHAQERHAVDIVLKMDAGIAYPLSAVRAVETQIWRAITTKQPIVRHVEAVEQPSPVGNSAPRLRSALFVPMVSGDRVVGVVAAHSFRERAYDQEDTLVMQAFAKQAAVAIDNARLFEQARSWASRLEAIQQVGADLQQCGTASEIGAAAARAMQALIPLDTYRIMLVEDDSQDLLTLTSGSTAGPDDGVQAGDLRVPKGEGPFGLCASQGDVVLINDATVESASQAASSAPPAAQSILAVPLRHHKAVFGVVGVTAQGHDRYRAEHGRLLQLVADHVASAVFTTLVIERTNHRLDRFNELDQMHTEFMSVVRHELRTPLTSILGFTEMLLHFWDRLTILRQKEMVSTIQVSTSRLQRLVDDLFSSSRLGDAALSLTLESVDLAAQIRQAIVEITTTHRGQVVVQEAPPEALSVRADAHRVQQVIVNLLDNAAKYSPEGSPIAVRWRVAGDFAEVSVEDSGPGIADSDMATLFTRFGRIERTIRPGQSGTGLGLYISRQLVEAMGGAIWVDTEVGHGSTFSFRLPLARELPDSPATEHAAQ